VPLRPTLSVELVALLDTLRVPVAGAIDVGANSICSVALCPTARELEGLPPTTAKTPPEMEAPEIVAVPVPVFVTVILWVDVLPTATFPKLMLAGEGVSTPPPELPTPLPLLLEALVV
jgi:hypothetical protein